MKLVVLVKVLLLLGCAAAYAQPVALEKLIQSIRQDYSSISHMTAGDLKKSLSDRTDVLLFDVREKIEYEVSHLNGAIRVDPGIWTSSFLKTYAQQTKGKTVVFYCSVGVRSSRLASRVKKQLMKAGAKDVHNLEGGIFHWHGSEFNLVNAKGKTDFVHPFNPYWGQLVRRRELLRSTTEK